MAKSLNPRKPDNKPITVGKLIAELEKLDPRLRVFVDGYEGDYDDPNLQLTVGRFRWRRGSWYMGDYENDEKGTLRGIVISR